MLTQLAGTATLLGPLQAAPEFVATPLGKLLVALVVAALVLFVGRYVLGVATKIIKLAIVVVGAIWLVSVVLPQLTL